MRPAGQSAVQLVAEDGARQLALAVRPKHAPRIPVAALALAHAFKVDCRHELMTLQK